jgi:capsule polysaccharide export protein KpsC/LpsZ
MPLQKFGQTFSLPPETIDRLLNDGDLRTVKLGAERFVPLSLIPEFIAQVANGEIRHAT